LIASWIITIGGDDGSSGTLSIIGTFHVGFDAPIIILDRYCRYRRA
jgi:hypothetical protein